MDTWEERKLNEATLDYEASVRWLRAQPDLAEFVKACYLDEDNSVAAQRFSQSEEFVAVVDLLSQAPDSRPRYVLDLGCGNGIVSYAFSARGWKVAALDPDPSDDVGLGATRRLREKNPALAEHIDPVHGFAEALPFPDGTFDAIYTRQAVHHFRDLAQAFAECHRTLKPGGLLLATREHVADNAQQLERFLANHKLHRLHGGENAFPLKTYLTTIQGAGLRMERCLGPYDNVINHFPETNADILRRGNAALKARLGGFLAGRLLALPVVEMLYRKYLSYRCDVPGRIYSFLARKHH